MPSSNLPPTTYQLPLVTIVGPTASGKTSLAIKLAQQYGGEIICADSRTVYQDTDIGTAKPSQKEQAEVPHWGLDLVRPNQHFNAADFQAYANQKIAEIRARGQIPFLVGGTGLYVDAVLYSYSFSAAADPGRRTELEIWSQQQLYEYCVNNNIQLPADSANQRHLVRAIERHSTSEISRQPLQANCFVVGIATAKINLERRIATRTEHLFKTGVVEEATMLGEKYGWESEAMTGNAYRLVRRHLLGELTLEDTKEKFTTTDRQLAKRQMTWFRPNPDIMWAELAGAEQYIYRLLASR